jgi:cytochrome bd-type quinol oxidase subunit 2
MKWPRFSLAGIAFAILVLGVDFAVVRRAFFTRLNIPENYCAIFVLLLLPMIDALLIGLHSLRRVESRSNRSMGFIFFGTFATVVVFVICLAKPKESLDLMTTICRPIALGCVNGLTRFFGNSAVQGWGAQLTLGILFELLLPIALFSLPPLAIALAGGWFAPRLHENLEDMSR